MTPPKRGEGRENLNPFIFWKSDPYWIQRSKKINFSSQILREYIAYRTIKWSIRPTKYQVSRISRETPAFWSRLPLNRRITKISSISSTELNLVSWFSAKWLKLLPSDVIFKAKMHQIRFRLGLCPRPRYRSSCTHSFDILSGFKGSYF